MPKPDVNESTLEDALWWPEYYNWGPSQTEEVSTQGGGTAVWSSDDNDYVFKTPPEWWTSCESGDIVPSQWGII